MSSASTRRITMALVFAGVLAASLLYYFNASQPEPPRLAPASRTAWPDFAATRAKAEAGDAGAQTVLARMLAAGQGAQRHYAAAARWYRKAADQGDAEARAGLAEL